MASGWAHFRKHWIKPEVYPLIGSMAAALGVCAAALINKAREPGVGWNKAKRKGGDLLEDVDEVVPMWSSAKNNSTRIFGSDNEIRESKKLFTALPDPVTIKIGEEEEENEEEDSVVAEEPAEPDAAADEPATAPAATEAVPVLDVVDEAAETINAAVDAAIESAAVAVKTDASEAAASSVAEEIAPAAEEAAPKTAQS